MCLQPIKEATLGNIPTIAFCDTDSPMRNVLVGEDICCCHFGNLDLLISYRYSGFTTLMHALINVRDFLDLHSVFWRSIN